MKLRGCFNGDLTSLILSEKQDYNLVSLFFNFYVNESLCLFLAQHVIPYNTCQPFYFSSHVCTWCGHFNCNTNGAPWMPCFRKFLVINYSKIKAPIFSQSPLLNGKLVKDHLMKLRTSSILASNWQPAWITI